MRWFTGLFVWLPILAGCGGVVHRNDSNTSRGGSTATSTGGGAAMTTPGTGGGSTASPGGSTTELVDDMEHTDGKYPRLPPGSGFFWSQGLGNWFVTSSDGITQDAPIEAFVTPDGVTGKACHVSSAAGVGVDLWAQLSHPTGHAVDLSAYSGVAFKVRLIGPSQTFIVAFSANGRFAPDMGFTWVKLRASEVWQTQQVLFEDVVLDDPNVSSIDFAVPASHDPVDLWIDDLTFLCKGTCP